MSKGNNQALIVELESHGYDNGVTPEDDETPKSQQSQPGTGAIQTTPEKSPTSSELQRTPEENKSPESSDEKDKDVDIVNIESAEALTKTAKYKNFIILHRIKLVASLLAFLIFLAALSIGLIVEYNLRIRTVGLKSEKLPEFSSEQFWEARSRAKAFPTTPYETINLKQGSYSQYFYFEERPPLTLVLDEQVIDGFFIPHQRFELDPTDGDSLDGEKGVRLIQILALKEGSATLRFVYCDPQEYTYFDMMK